MSDVAVTINLTVTPNPLDVSGYSWEYSDGNGSPQPLSGATLFRITPGNTASVTMNIQAGTPGDTCVFQNPASSNPPNQLEPLTFYKSWIQNPDQTISPEWLEDLAFTTNSTTGLSNGTITFTDGNMNTSERTYYFVINAVYTRAQQEGANITSPEPTIVNAATDGLPILPPWRETLEPGVTAAV